LAIPSRRPTANFATGCCRALAEEPTLISGLVRLATLSGLLPTIGEGLREHGWTEVELRALERDLSGLPLWEDYRLALSRERGFGNAILDSLASSSPAQRAQYLPIPNAVSSLMPRRLFRDNQLR
jgi:hypothetical protein